MRWYATYTVAPTEATTTAAGVASTDAQTSTAAGITSTASTDAQPSTVTMMATVATDTGATSAGQPGGLLTCREEKYLQWLNQLRLSLDPVP